MPKPNLETVAEDKYRLNGVRGGANRPHKLRPHQLHVHVLAVDAPKRIASQIAARGDLVAGVVLSQWIRGIVIGVHECAHAIQRVDLALVPAENASTRVVHI